MFNIVICLKHNQFFFIFVASGGLYSFNTSSIRPSHASFLFQMNTGYFLGDRFDNHKIIDPAEIWTFDLPGLYGCIIPQDHGALPKRKHQCCNKFIRGLLIELTLAIWMIFAKLVLEFFLCLLSCFLLYKYLRLLTFIFLFSCRTQWGSLVL